MKQSNQMRTFIGYKDYVDISSLIYACRCLTKKTGVHVAGEYIEVSDNARDIGVIFYSHVNLEKTAFYHLRNIAKIRNCLSQDNAETLVHAFISSKLDSIWLTPIGY